MTTLSVFTPAPAFDPQHMERRKGPDRELPVPMTLKDAHEHAKLANAAYRLAKADREKAANVLAAAKAADKEAQQKLDEALAKADRHRQEADELVVTITAPVELYFDYRDNVVIEVRTDRGFELVEHDRRAMTQEERRDLLARMGTDWGDVSNDEAQLNADNAKHHILAGYVETAHRLRGCGAHDRGAFIADVLGYSPLYGYNEVAAAVDAFLAEQERAETVLAHVAAFIENIDLLSEYPDMAFDTLVFTLSEDIAANDCPIADGGEVTAAEIASAVMSVLDRAHLDVVLAKLADTEGQPLPKGKTPKTLAKETSLDAARVKALLETAKARGLVDKRSRSWVRLPSTANAEPVSVENPTPQA